MSKTHIQSPETRTAALAARHLCRPLQQHASLCVRERARARERWIRLQLGNSEDFDQIHQLYRFLKCIDVLVNTPAKAARAAAPLPALRVLVLPGVSLSRRLACAAACSSSG
jgi:hypothetical protein